MPWLHGVKIRHEHQKEADYLKNEPFSKCSNYFLNACKKLLEKKIDIQNSLPEVFLKNTVRVSFLTDLQLC